MNINSIPFVLIKCLLLTIIIELSIALLLKVRDKKDILNIILVNIITNPVVVMSQILLYLYFGYKIEVIGVIILEILVVPIEGLIYKKVLNYKSINPILLSLILNASSLIIGLIINKF